MQIKIISHGDGIVWYANHVGKVFDVVREDRETSDVFWAREPEGFINIVYKKDAQIVQESQ
jgi:hypothetical protein